MIAITRGSRSLPAAAFGARPLTQGSSAARLEFSISFRATPRDVLERTTVPALEAGAASTPQSDVSTLAGKDSLRRLTSWT